MVYFLLTTVFFCNATNYMYVVTSLRYLAFAIYCTGLTVINRHILHEAVFTLHMHPIIFISYSQPSLTTNNPPCLFYNWGLVIGQVLTY